ncbi:hypothetical protein [Leeia oryzae]|uniref:hypothetical protein n=1 Tax=Leeia oryzae TaxID=356662 RepID=UPI00039E6B57|nr:hypothetical protein [Leeia oryzae]
MRKLLPVALMLCALTAGAENWISVGNDNRVDLDAVKRNGDLLTYAIRWDSPTPPEEYVFTEIETNCKTGDTHFPRVFFHKKTGPQGYQPTTGDEVKHAVPEEGTVVSVLNHQLCSGKATAASIERILLGE